jgi:hypothetical protein
MSKAARDLPKFKGIFRQELERALRARGGKGGLAGVAESCGKEGPSRDLARVIEELKTVDQPWERDGDGGRSDLVGLAFSGGGIRSATFNLGVLQALGWLGLFRCVDYLSTVSGGGYLGACVSSVYSELGDRDQFPFAHKRGEREPALFRHLRDNASYLAPDGLLDFLRIPALLLRGILLHFVAVAPYVLGAALLTFVLLKAHAGQGDIPDSGFIVTLALLGMMAALMLGFSAFHFFFQGYALVGTWQARNFGGRALGGLLLAIGVAFFVELQPCIIQLAFDWTRNGWLSQLPALGQSALGLAPFAGAAVALVKPLLRGGRLTIYLLSALGFLSTWAIYLVLSAALLRNGASSAIALGALTAVLLAYSLLTIDLNYTSLHRFYRDRLSKAYLVRSGGSQGYVHDEATDRQKLSELGIHGPYHLINTAINVDDPGDEYKRGRAADAFLFSPGFIGSEITGYVPSTLMESASRQVNLGTAMAISGAAVAPAGGSTIPKPLRFLMALLDIRLNYWLPNPSHIKEPRRASVVPRILQRAGVGALAREMFGGLRADSPIVNLSDGGHFENLGIYELIRRRCRLIIASDAECDPRFEFNGLANAIRMVLIDFGTQIEIDGLDEIRRGEQHHAIGTIRYGDGIEGRLIYLKASVRGDASLAAALPREAYLTSPYRADNLGYDQSPYIARYRAAHPEFPHESTGDQFFDEEQFESYRALGYEVATSALRA